MDFTRDHGLDAFREKVRSFLRQHLPPDLAGGIRVGSRSPNATLSRWQRILHEQGWGAPYWRKEHGGTGWSVLERLVFEEECAAVGTPSQDLGAHRLLGPVVSTFGTQAQKAEHLPPILRGERMWCQGFSEPGSGSDLASLRMRAQRQGDQYVVNGQKIWTSYAHRADWIFLLVRTDAAAAKHAGISFLLVDMKSPGITVRPIITIDGCHHLNETFFDNVRVPVGNLVGAEGDGWKLTKFLLNNEHAAAADLATLRSTMARIRRLASAGPPDGPALIERPAFALKLARAQASLSAIAMLVMRVAALEGDHGPQAHALGSILKLRGTELLQELSGLVTEAAGDWGAVAYPDPDEPSGEPALPMQDAVQGLAATMFFRRAATIYGGTSEIQRSIIARSLFRF